MGDVSGTKKKPFTEAEEIIVPAMCIVSEEFLEQSAKAKIENILLSNSTVERRSRLLSEDLLHQVVEKLRTSHWYGLQFDESTDISNSVQVMDLLECHDIPLERCSSVTTDGAAAMVSVRNGSAAMIKEHAPDCASSHCDLYRQILASKKLSHDNVNRPFDEVMEQSVKIINSIKSKAKHSGMFQQLCEDIEECDRTLLYYCEVRWLSRGTALRRLFDLQKCVYEFLYEIDCPKAVHFHNDLWISKLGFLADMFEKLNVLNVSLQGKDMYVFSTSDKIEVFEMKLSLWKRRVEGNDLSAFSQLPIALTEGSDENFEHQRRQLILEHLGGLKRKL
ncbi:zinc finger MYM-type protein 6-like [Homarus americanus]|uniref:zinc finger MYM-type protein 6-like n=1 Tax=Homarus americanus TaxID=6706 RepID=UPI001C44ABCB|nr:zinc finger MYM-type protein 6-like [Homarus americanus]